MVNKSELKKTCSQKCGTGKGWYEDEDPRLGKALRHSEVAQKEKLRDTLTRPMKKEESLDENMTEEIVEEVQSKRKPQAVAKDNAHTAEKVRDKDDVEDLVERVREPGKSDLEGMDTKGSNPNEEVEE
jgi:hypothetical protein